MASSKRGAGFLGQFAIRKQRVVFSLRAAWAQCPSAFARSSGVSGAVVPFSGDGNKDQVARVGGILFFKKEVAQARCTAVNMHSVYQFGCRVLVG